MPRTSTRPLTALDPVLEVAFARLRDLKVTQLHVRVPVARAHPFLQRVAQHLDAAAPGDALVALFEAAADTAEHPEDVPLRVCEAALRDDVLRGDVGGAAVAALIQGGFSIVAVHRTHPRFDDDAMGIEVELAFDLRERAQRGRNLRSARKRSRSTPEAP